MGVRSFFKSVFSGGKPATQSEVRVIDRPSANAMKPTPVTPPKPAASIEPKPVAQPVAAGAAAASAGTVSTNPSPAPGSTTAKEAPVSPITVRRKDAPADQAAIEAARLTELREQYERVVNLIEKVDKHLDQQESRSQRIMEVVERFPAETLARLDSLGSRIDGVGGHIQSMGSNLDSLSAQQGEMTRSLATVNESISTSMTGLQTSFGELTTSNAKLQELIAGMNQRDQDRDARLQTHMDHTQRHNEVMEKWMIGMLVLGTIGVAAAIVVAAFVVLNNGATPPTP